MMRIRALACTMSLLLGGGPALAEYCAPEVEQAQERVRKQHVDGMTGVATQNFSSRPGTFGDMACLEGLMQGQMDILFRPPDLQSLLQEVVAFACEQIEQELAGALGGSGDLGDFGSLTGGGLQIPGGGSLSSGRSSTVNLSRVMETFE